MATPQNPAVRNNVEPIERARRERTGDQESTPERSYQRLAEEITTLIAQGELKVGERLPSERALAERFDVSRTAVREAVIALEIQSVVEVRGGSGIYVSRRTDAKQPVYMPESGPGPFELLRARWLIESEIAALAAQDRKDADIDRIHAQLVAMSEHFDDKRANEAADRLFHIRIAEATGNSVLAHVVSALWEQLRGPIWAKIEEHFHTPELREASLQDHQQVFKAIVARDPDAARDAMRRHLERVMNEFTQAWR